MNGTPQDVDFDRDNLNTGHEGKIGWCSWWGRDSIDFTYEIYHFDPYNKFKGFILDTKKALLSFYKGQSAVKLKISVAKDLHPYRWLQIVKNCNFWGDMVLYECNAMLTIFLLVDHYNPDSLSKKFGKDISTYLEVTYPPHQLHIWIV